MSIDKSAHELFRYAGNKESCFRYLRGEHIPCPVCGNELEATYCEERLYMIRCGHCKIVVLSEGKSPRDAAGKLGVMAKQDEEG